MPSPRGQVLDQSLVTKLALTGHLVFICGHFKGIDERVHEFYPIEEVSIGDYVISSGEIAALVMIDAVIRLLPGVISDIESAWTDSFNDDLLDAPCYTRPEEFRGKAVPEVLLSGNHQKIETWRLEKKEELTRSRRPDLYKKYKDLIV
jgi:tRNA (guanine37-N1)-methyltransferase